MKEHKKDERTKKEWYDRILELYQILDDEITCISLTIIAIAIRVDVLLRSFFRFVIGKTLCYENENIFTLALTIWTFITVLIIFYLERMNERCFGVRLKDVLELKNKEKRNKFLGKVGVFVVELVVLVIASIIDLPITLVGLTVLQVLTMIYALLMIYCNTSETIILRKIKREFKDALKEAKGDLKSDEKMLYQKRLLIQMISNLDYNQIEKKDCLLEVLCQEDAYHNKEIKYVLRTLAKLILQYAKEGTAHRLILNNWICFETIPKELRCEILHPYIQSGDSDHLADCMNIIASLEEKEQRKAIIYCITYNEVLKEKVDESYRNSYIQILKTMLQADMTAEESVYMSELKEIFEKEEKDA